MRTAPYCNAIKDWQATGVAPNYCMWGQYVGYLGDNSTTGSNHTQILNLDAHTGQPTEIVMGALSLTLGNPTRVNAFVGMPQHKYLQVPLCPNNGTYLPKTVDGTNDHYFTAIVAAMIAAGLDMTLITIVAGWEYWLGNVGTFQWSQSATNTVAVYNAAFRQMVTVMRAAGFTGTFMVDQTGATVADIAAGTLWPGDAYADMYGYHCYNGIPGSSSYRTNVAGWWTDLMKPRLDALTTFARAHGKLCGSSEMGLQQPSRYDTTSNTYNYHTQDTLLYWPYIHDYMRDNCDRWVGIAMFNQDQPGGATTQNTEFNQMYYFGTNPSSQPAENPRDTNATGTVYDSIAFEHSLSTPAHVRSVMIPGTMQIATAPPPPTGGGGTTATTTLLFMQAA